MAKKPWEMTWPRKGDKAFVPGADKRWSVQLDWFEVLDNDRMIAEGFKDAADRVVASLETGSHTRHPDRSFFPVAYLYRHSIELYLKEIVRLGQSLNLGDAGKDVMAAHNLHALWGKARQVLETMWPGADPEPLLAAEKVILDFHKIDRSGQELRYARSKEQKPHLEQAPRIIDLVQMKDVMETVLGFLDSCLVGMDVALEQIADARAYERDLG